MNFPPGVAPTTAFIAIGAIAAWLALTGHPLAAALVLLLELIPLYFLARSMAQPSPEQRLTTSPPWYRLTIRILLIIGLLLWIPSMYLSMRESIIHPSLLLATTFTIFGLFGNRND
ncbi:hypothetical protein [Corynebacterium nasicanis]|uniref:Uncharacterized protein n=1 Tax=Corynebacterium nasicanis TaxID=1448267 RepID=A0ABW1QET5_9CORY